MQLGQMATIHVVQYTIIIPQNSLSNPLPPLSPQSFGELKPPSMNDKNSPWQEEGF